MVNTQITFELKNRFSELDNLGEKLDQFCSQLGLTNKCLCEINLALEELFTNIISYGYDDEAEHWVKFTLSYQNGTIRMEGEDEETTLHIDCHARSVGCSWSFGRCGSD